MKDRFEYVFNRLYQLCCIVINCNFHVSSWPWSFSICVKIWKSDFEYMFKGKWCSKDKQEPKSVDWSRYSYWGLYDTTRHLWNSRWCHQYVDESDWLSKWWILWNNHNITRRKIPWIPYQMFPRKYQVQISQLFPKFSIIMVRGITDLKMKSCGHYCLLLLNYLKLCCLIIFQISADWLFIHLFDTSFSQFFIHFCSQTSYYGTNMFLIIQHCQI